MVADVFLGCLRVGRVGTGEKLKGRRSSSGQMAVELAVLMPVIIVVAIAVYNLGRFVALCATFDRVAYDAVLSQGIAPAGAQTELTAVGEVQAAIEEALAADRLCTVTVRLEGIGPRSGQESGNRGVVLSPFLTKFTCTLRYQPVPSSLAIAGVELGAPPSLVHEREIVVDRYRPGVVL